jgi:hypothetical protein|tara:strand:+ start:4673 stop:5017 length:345 start_codon:yes stop_codon:yes gene_type:complete
MSTHAQLGVKMPDNKIVGCYVHYDGGTMRPRIEDYLEKYSATGLVVLISQAQATGGIRSFHSPNDPTGYEYETEFLDDQEEYVIDGTNWQEDHFGARYRYLIDYKTGEIKKRSN